VGLGVTPAVTQASPSQASTRLGTNLSAAAASQAVTVETVPLAALRSYAAFAGLCALSRRRAAAAAAGRAEYRVMGSCNVQLVGLNAILERLCHLYL
jgi:hypothetical protein